MTYSYTQISQYLTCPRRYRHRYLDGWREKDIRAAMLFGRAFEQAVAAYFRREESPAVLFREWAKHQDTHLEYTKGDTWDRMLQQGIQLVGMDMLNHFRYSPFKVETIVEVKSEAKGKVLIQMTVSFGKEEPAGFESVRGCWANTGPAEANKPAIPNRDKNVRRVDVPNPLTDSDVSSLRFSSGIQPPRIKCNPVYSEETAKIKQDSVRTVALNPVA